MGDLDRLIGLLGPPQKPECDADAWTEVEDYVGSAMPGDFKAFLDAFGSGVISGEFVVLKSRAYPSFRRGHDNREFFPSTMKLRTKASSVRPMFSAVAQ